MIKKIAKIIGIFALGILGGIFADQVFRFYLPPEQDGRPIYMTEKKEVVIRENIALTNSIEKVKNTVIGVKSKTQAGKIIEGSGLTITADGLIVALADLIPQGSTFYFYIDGRPVAYQILKRDAKLNLALIKVEKNNLATASFAEMDKIKLGQRVFSLGVIFASSTPENIIDEGIIRKLSANFIETNMVKIENAQGSILFDIEGNVVGINQTDEEGNLTTIPISVIKGFVGL
jgi:serine protease Do